MKHLRQRFIRFPQGDYEYLRTWIVSQKKYISINIDKKRNRIKFERDKWRYIKDWVKFLFLAHMLAVPVRRYLDYVGIFRKIMIEESLPQGNPIIFDK